MNKLILVLNCGSSSIKFAIIEPISGAKKLSGAIDSIASNNTKIGWKTENNEFSEKHPNLGYKDALEYILLKIAKSFTDNIAAVGHRVVHGGEYFSESVIIDNKVIDAIKACIDLAPLHNPAHLQGIEAVQEFYPKLPQVAVFDTSYHQTLPEYAYIYPIPYELYTNNKIRRYGFHGTSYRFVSQEAAKILNIPYENGSFIIAHLGNGCTACAISNGKSVDTSAGLTPIEGLIMGTRSGDIDPGLHAHLVDTAGYDIHDINNMLYKESGLLGISGTSSDMRLIEKAISAEKDERAELALSIFCYRLAKYIGAYTIPLDKLDAVIFTGGIGENSALVRAKTIQWLKILNFKLDEEANANHGKNNNGIITKSGSPIAMVIPTNEELLIARDTASLTSITSS